MGAKKKSQPKARNPFAYALAIRGAGRKMKDRRAPRGGQRNEQADLLEEYEHEKGEDQDE